MDGQDGWTGLQEQVDLVALEYVVIFKHTHFQQIVCCLGLLTIAFGNGADQRLKNT